MIASCTTGRACISFWLYKNSDSCRLLYIKSVDLSICRSERKDGEKEILIWGVGGIVSKQRLIMLKQAHEWLINQIMVVSVPELKSWVRGMPRSAPIPVHVSLFIMAKLVEVVVSLRLSGLSPCLLVSFTSASHSRIFWRKPFKKKFLNCPFHNQNQQTHTKLAPVKLQHICYPPNTSPNFLPLKAPILFSVSWRLGLVSVHGETTVGAWTREEEETRKEQRNGADAVSNRTHVTNAAHGETNT